MARLERQNYMQAKQNLQWDMHNVRERLHEARAISRIQPYLRRDSSQKEKIISPAQSRGARNEDVEKRRACQSRYVCPYCRQQGHYRHQCRHPHLICSRIRARWCEIPLTHHYFTDYVGDCPAMGHKSEALAGEDTNEGGPSRSKSPDPSNN